ncbi:hypothetical protein OR1_02581 [Geobacter sp. OR-1]|nr:hypothetical protein OR1_02581 [Geobacter sp. OR-1]
MLKTELKLRQEGIVVINPAIASVVTGDVVVHLQLGGLSKEIVEADCPDVGSDISGIGIRNPAVEPYERLVGQGIIVIPALLGLDRVNKLIAEVVEKGEGVPFLVCFF